MSKTNFQDPQTSEIRSTHLSGLQEAASKLEDAVNLKTQAETGISLNYVLSYNPDTQAQEYRIYQAPKGKRNWVLSPSPVIKKNDVVIETGFTIDYAGGAIIVSPTALDTDVFTADATYTIGEMGEEYSDPVDITAWIYSLPSNVANGLFSECIVKGNTLVNLPDWGGCEATTGWTAYNGTVAIDTSNKFEGTNCLKITIGAGQTSAGIYRDVSSLLDTSKHYLFSAHLKKGNLSGSGCKLQVDCVGDGGAIDSSWVTNESYIREGIVIQPSDFDTASEVRVYIAIYGAENEYAYVDAISILEISSTEYAEGAEVLMAKKNYTTPGVAVSTNPYLLQSVGKNLFDGEMELGAYNTSTGEKVSSSTITRSKNFIRVKPSTTYTLSQSSTAKTVNLLYYTENKSYISVYVGSQFTTPANCGYVTFYYSTGYENTSELQIVEGADTTFTKYEIGEAFCPVELHSTPDGTKCEFDYKTGKHTKKHNKIVLTGNETVNIYTTKTNTIVFRIAMDGMKAIRSAEIISSNNFPSIDVIGANDVEGITAFTNAEAYLGILKSKLDTENVSGFKTWLAANLTSVIYQLANSQTYEYPEHATPLKAYPNGTIMILPRVKFNAYPNAATGEITIQNTSIPIDSLVSLKKITIVGGKKEYKNVDFTDSDYNTTTISPADSLALDRGSQYVVEYDYPSELTTIPTVKIAYPISLKSTAIQNSKAVAVLDDEVDDLNDFTVAMFMAMVGLPQMLIYQVEGLVADADIVNRILVQVPSGYTITLNSASIISHGTPAGIDDSNTCVVSLTDGTNTIVEKTYNTGTPFPADGVIESLGTLNETYKILAEAEKLYFNVTSGATANPPAFILQVSYTIIKNA